MEQWGKKYFNSWYWKKCHITTQEHYWEIKYCCEACIFYRHIHFTDSYFTSFHLVSSSLTWSDHTTSTSGSHGWLTVTLSVCACRREITGFTHLKCLTGCVWLGNDCGCQHLQTVTSHDWIWFDHADEYRKSFKRHRDNVN